ncbi:uncharacterized protein LOC117788051 [Drosophila innubila]|uniref:uncharacterized protein LOC117788051 n=1 Tax=Drosophila innubila TaxID=198719 RepID=UPI00148D0A86|nr:uncharacterized protein LOC117788051 [Drosophila innubila]
MFRLLLVVAVVCCAQSRAAVTSQHPRLLQALGDATKALQAAQQSLEDAIQKPPSPTLTSVSVVQDWSLVCKELCGAGLGVTPCANYCPKSGVGMAKILNTNFDLAKCEQLTGTQNGTPCKGVDTVKSYGDRLCSSFCHQRRRTLQGCSPCQLLSISTDEVSTEQSVTPHGSGTDAKVMAMKLAMEKIEASAADTDTPDWNEMCKTLCKTGDGGSLCNCDLSPFFT